MTIVIDCRLAFFLILTFLCESVDCNMDHPLANSTHLVNAEKPVKANQWQFSSSDIIAFVKSFDKEKPWNLRLLYDQEYKEIVNDMTHGPSDDLFGLVALPTDRKADYLYHMLFSSEGTIFLMVLCSPESILRIFEEICIHRLINDSVNWILFLEGTKAEGEVVLGLEGLLRDDTQVTLVTKEAKGTLKISPLRHHHLEGGILWHPMTIKSGLTWRQLVSGIILKELLMINQSLFSLPGLADNRSKYSRPIRSAGPGHRLLSLTQLPNSNGTYFEDPSLIDTGETALSAERSPVSRTSGIKSSIMKAVLREDEELEEEESEKSLMGFMKYLVERELSDCDLLIGFDKHFLGSKILDYLVNLSNSKQVFLLDDYEIFSGAIWSTGRCRGTLFLVSDPEFLTTFATISWDYWDYEAKVVIVGLREEQLKALFQHKQAKLRKTEHVVGVVKGDQPGDYSIYKTELLFFGARIKYIGTWRRGIFPGKDLFPDKTSSLQQMMLTVTTFEFNPNIFFHFAPNGTLLYRYGFEVEVAKALSGVFKFTYKHEDSPVGQLWGKQLPNGSFTGMVGLLGSGRSQFGFGNVYISSTGGRLAFIELSAPYTTDAACVLTKMEPPLPRWQSLGFPFQMETWITIFIGLIFTGPAVFLLAMASAKRGPENPSFLSMISSIFHALRLHTRQSLEVLPLQMCNQVLIIFLWLYAIILTTAYSSNLTAFLTVTRQPRRMETFRDLYEANIKVHALGPFPGQNLRDSGNKYNVALYERFSVLPLKAILKELLAGRGVFLNSIRYLDFQRQLLATSKGEQRARLMTDCVAQSGVGLAFERHSPLKRKFDRVLRWIFESGLIGHWHLKSLMLYRKLKRESEKQQDSSSSEVEQKSEAVTSGVIPLSIDHMQGIFIILAFGCVISTLLFLLELCLFE